MVPTSILFYKEVGHSQEGAKEVVALFGDKGVFDGPKPVRLLQRLITLANLNDDSIVLDFFSGSASTAHALMKSNSEKNTHCKFILIQLPEPVSDAKKNQGFGNICKIGEERIRLAGERIRNEELEKRNKSADDDNSLFHTPNSSLTDTGFRVLKLDTSNMEDVFYTPDKFEPSLLDGLVDNIKADRTPEDLLFQAMLDLGVELSASIRKEELGGRDCFIVDDGYLIACFDKEVNETTVGEMAKLLPAHLIIRDASVANDNLLDNFEQIIKSYSSEKTIKTYVL